jgi:hypothetical protein
MFLRNVGSYKIHKTPHSRRRHSLCKKSTSSGALILMASEFICLGSSNFLPSSRSYRVYSCLCIVVLRTNVLVKGKPVISWLPVATFPVTIDFPQNFGLAICGFSSRGLLRNVTPQRVRENYYIDVNNSFT